DIEMQSVPRYLSLKSICTAGEVHIAWLGHTRNRLPHAPQHTTWVEEHEVAHAPRTILRRLNRESESLGDATVLNMLPPIFHVFDKQVHFETVDVLLHEIVLQEKG